MSPSGAREQLIPSAAPGSGSNRSRALPEGGRSRSPAVPGGGSSRAQRCPRQGAADPQRCPGAGAVGPQQCPGAGAVEPQRVPRGPAPPHRVGTARAPAAPVFITCAASGLAGPGRPQSRPLPPPCCVVGRGRPGGCREAGGGGVEAARALLALGRGAVLGRREGAGCRARLSGGNGGWRDPQWRREGAGAASADGEDQRGRPRSGE